MRLIDADAVVTIQTYDDMYEEWGTKTMTIAEALDEFSDEGCPPTVDAEPVRHGSWGLPEIVGYDGIHAKWAAPCKKCWKYTTEYNKPYCPNCGAKMDGGKE